MPSEPPYFASVPVPLDVELARRASDDPDGFKHQFAKFELGNQCRRLEGKCSKSLGGMTMIGDIVWQHEQGRWHRWERFGWDGWLITETKPTRHFGVPKALCEKGTWFLRHKAVREEHGYDSAEKMFADENKRREAGLRLTATYRQNYERQVAKADRKAGRISDAVSAPEDFSPICPNT